MVTVGSPGFASSCAQYGNAPLCVVGFKALVRSLGITEKRSLLLPGENDPPCPLPEFFCFCIDSAIL